MKNPAESWKTSKRDLRYISTCELDHETEQKILTGREGDENVSGIESARNENIHGKIINQLLGVFEIKSLGAQEWKGLKRQFVISLCRVQSVSKWHAKKLLFILQATEKKLKTILLFAENKWFIRYYSANKYIGSVKSGLKSKLSETGKLDRKCLPWDRER